MKEALSCESVCTVLLYEKHCSVLSPYNINYNIYLSKQKFTTKMKIKINVQFLLVQISTKKGNNWAKYLRHYNNIKHLCINMKDLLKELELHFVFYITNLHANTFKLRFSKHICCMIYKANSFHNNSN